MNFSQRHGHSPATKAIQIESMDQDLRTSLWNVIYAFVFADGELDYKIVATNDYCKEISCGLFHQVFKRPIDTIPVTFHSVVSITREHIEKAKWYEIYDLIEYFIDFLKKKDQQTAIGFIEVLNKNLERESSGYRILNFEVSPITSQEELQAIDEAISQSISQSAISPGVNTHLSTALRMLSDRKNPDYRNSIKESISAVEAHCKKISKTQVATLSDALKVLERRGGLHPALKSGFSAIYGFTSDANGIRHALMEESELKFADAKFMLVSCSAFINYLIEKYP